jgi:phytoene dehydrogenase-like protein
MTKQIAVVGGGMAGLASALTARRAGAEVVLFEARERLGGRARTNVIDGFCFNQGPHALYQGMAGAAVLRDLGVVLRGKRPPLSGGYGRLRGDLGLLPGTPSDAVRSNLVGLRTKAQLGRLMARPKRLLRTEVSGRSMAQWIDEQLADADARAILAMISRVASYVDDLASVAAEAVVPQVISAMVDGVVYLDGGWQQLVDSLRELATDAGVKIDVDAKIESIAELDDADTVIVAAGGPSHAARLVGGASSVVHEWAAAARPVFAASLDLALRELPRPERRVCFGVDDPIYLSVHTPSAQLAPGGGEVLHVMRYGDPDADPRTELEAFLDQAQPGWRELVLAQRYGRRLVVSHSRPTPVAGFAGRPGPAIPDCPGVFVAGDWVGDTGLLVDAALASARSAALLALAAS